MEIWRKGDGDVGEGDEWRSGGGVCGGGDLGRGNLGGVAAVLELSGELHFCPFLALFAGMQLFPEFYARLPGWPITDVYSPLLARKDKGSSCTICEFRPFLGRSWG